MLLHNSLYYICPQLDLDPPKPWSFLSSISNYPWHHVQQRNNLTENHHWKIEASGIDSLTENHYFLIYIASCYKHQRQEIYGWNQKIDNELDGDWIEAFWKTIESSKPQLQQQSAEY